MFKFYKINKLCYWFLYKKYVILVIVKPLTYICNISLSNGVFPKHMKIAKIIPVFKNGDQTSSNNYRLISLLP